MMLRLLLVMMVLASPAAAKVERPTFNPQIGAQLPLAGRFDDASGHRVSLSDTLAGKPALLLIGYNRCPNLCGVTQQSVAMGLLQANLEPGSYHAIFISVDERETAADGRAARQKLAEAVSGDGLSPWRFLTSSDDSGLVLARKAGFEFKARARIAQFVHPVAVIALTSDGRIARVLPAMTFTPRDLRLALVEASSGKLGSLADQVFLLCAGFDTTKGQYTPAVWAALQAGGVLTFGLLVVAVAGMARGRRR